MIVSFFECAEFLLTAAASEVLIHAAGFLLMESCDMTPVRLLVRSIIQP